MLWALSRHFALIKLLSWHVRTSTHFIVIFPWQHTHPAGRWTNVLWGPAKVYPTVFNVFVIHHSLDLFFFFAFCLVILDRPSKQKAIFSSEHGISTQNAHNFHSRHNKEAFSSVFTDVSLPVFPELRSSFFWNRTFFCPATTFFYTIQQAQEIYLSVVILKSPLTCTWNLSLAKSTGNLKLGTKRSESREIK